MKKELLLQLDNVSVRYGSVHALDGADIAVDEGEIVALMGQNGAGKSTALKAIFGLAPVAAGKILWHGAPIRPVPHEIVRRGVAFVPQGRRVFARLTVEENLEMGGQIVHDKKELRRRMDEVMDLFPALRAKRREKSGALSGGQQQMLAIARGLMADPKVLLLDEPSLGLAPKIVKEVFARIREINERHRTAIVVVEHNIKSILEIVDRAYVLDKGRVVESGDPRAIVASGVLEKVFVGRL